MGDKLLEILRSKAGLDYICDLRFPIHRPSVKRALQKIRLTDYSLEEWSYVLSYTFERTLKFETMDDLTGFLRDEVYAA